MKKGRRQRSKELALAGLVLLLGSWLPAGALAGDAAGGKQSPAADTPAPDDLPRYVPPDLGTPDSTEGAADRGGPADQPLGLLAPDHVGLTTLEQPTLYWYLAERSTAPVEITLRTSETTLFHEELPPPVEAGLREVRLSDRGVRLALGVQYSWFVSIVRDAERPAKNPTVDAPILRREPSGDLRRRLAATPQGREVFVYAESGIWYDAIAAVSARIAAAPADPRLRAQRAALLDQVGLAEIAAYDRSGLGAN